MSVLLCMNIIYFYSSILVEFGLYICDVECIIDYRAHKNLFSNNLLNLYEVMTTFISRIRVYALLDYYAIGSSLNQ